ncbi:MAG TPA: DUF4199 family protein [Turneriella sp.]|nr:DUF4199 family protein [Turneriella sp.]
MKIFFRNLLIAYLLTFSGYMLLHVIGFNTTDHNKGDIARTSLVVISWCMIFVTIVQMRALETETHHFLTAFRYGFLFAVFFSLGFTLFLVLYQHVINPKFYSTYRTYFENRLLTAQISAETLSTKMRQFDMSYDGKFPSYLLFFLSNGMGGIVTAAIAAAIFREKKQKGDNYPHKSE